MSPLKSVNMLPVANPLASIIALPSPVMEIGLVLFIKMPFSV